MSGRPLGRDNRHLSDCLLSAAAECLHGKSHLEITSREIASGAGTHAGMVNYYFNNKDGLLSTLIDGISADADRHMREIEAAVDAGVEDPTAAIVRGLIEAYLPHSHSMSVAFIEMFRQQSGIKDAYSRHGGSQTFSRLERLVRKLVASGQYRQDLDPTMTTWMMLCLVIGPHLLDPVRRAMRSTTQAPDTEPWVNEVTELLRRHVTQP